MFFVVRSKDSFNFPLGLIKYIVIVTDTCLGRNLHQQMHILLILKGLKGNPQPKTSVGLVSQFGRAVRLVSGQGNRFDSPLWLSSLFKRCDLWTHSRDAAPRD